MAYAANITVTTTVISGVKHWIVDVTETEAESTSEYHLEARLLPRLGRVVNIKATKTAGTGATFAPKIGLATNWSANTQDDVYAHAGHASHIHVAPTAPSGHFRQSDGLYVRSSPASGADNAITTQLIIVEGIV